INLLIVNWNSNWPEGFRPMTSLSPVTVATLTADAQREPMRYAVEKELIFPPNEAEHLGLESMDGDIYFMLGRTYDLLHIDNSWRQWQLFNVRWLITDRDVDADGVTRVPGSDQLKLYRMQYPLPRAYVVWNTRLANGPQQALDMVKDAQFNPGETAIVEQQTTTPITAPADKQQTVNVSPMNAQEVRIDTATSGNGFLVLSYPFYPGWAADIDGQRLTLQRANYAFEGLAVPAGKHVVTLRYQPRSFEVGAALGIANLLVFVGLMVFTRLKRGAEGRTMAPSQ
ncbi:MAG: YfhO family protein, partial [Chloroflexi bacterium]|nr:YfhO family protein [Chloroflexota bacterium]